MFYDDYVGWKLERNLWNAFVNLTLASSLNQLQEINLPEAANKTKE